MDKKEIFEKELEKLQAGDHVCFIYGTEDEKRSFIGPYIRHGLDKNEKIIYITHASSFSDIEKYLANEGVDAGSFVDGGQIVILSYENTYLKGGVFDPSRMIQMLSAETDKAVAEGYKGLRIAGEMSWALEKTPGRGRLYEYGVELNRFFPSSGALAVCQYDARIFDAETLIKVISCHPVAVVGTEIFRQNIYYTPPEGGAEQSAVSMFKKQIENLRDLKNRSAKESEISREKQRLLDVGEQSRMVLLSMVEDLQKAEEELQERELHFRTLADSGRALVWTSGVDKKCNYFNQPWLDFTGRTIEQELGYGWTEGVHPDDFEKCVTTYKNAFDKREPFAMVYRLRREDGVYRWVQDDGMPRYDLKCNFIGYIGHCLDITELKEAQERLGFINRLLEAVQDFNQHIIKRDFMEEESLMEGLCSVLHDKAGYPLVIAGKLGKKPARISSLRAAGIPAESLKEVIAMQGNSGNENSSFLSAVFGGEVVVRKDIKRQKDENHDCFPWISCALELGCESCIGLPIFLNERIAGFITICSDRYAAFEVEESTILEELANDASLAWETIVAERERNALTEQLVRAEKLAAVGELIAGVAHEINNPLTGIVGFSELLLLEGNEKLDEDTRKSVEYIHKSSERICRIVTNLLRFSRREAPMRKNISVAEVMDRVLDIRDYELVVRNIKLKKEYQPGVPNIMADPSQLEQVFLNLINNAEYAIKETGREGILAIKICTEKFLDGKDCVAVEISDTGFGIPQKVLGRLFDPFFTTKPVGKGTGLGLSVSYGIIKEHGGEIAAFNREEGGAVFSIKLPVRENQDVK